MRKSRLISVCVVAALTASACGGSAEVQADPDRTAAPQPAEVNESNVTEQVVTDSDDTPETATTTSAPDVADLNDMPAWLAGLPVELESADLQPSALAFSERFADPGLHYSFSPGLEWELVGSSGPEVAPITQWSAGDVSVATGSVPIPDLSLSEFIAAQLPGELLFVDETHALVRGADPNGVQYQLFAFDIDRTAFMFANFSSEPDEEIWTEMLPVMVSLERTPLNEDELVTPSEAELEFWLNQFETAPPGGDLLAETQSPLEVSTCVASSFASDRLTRYGNIDIATVDPANETEVAIAGNYLADTEELLAFCGLPSGILGQRLPS